MKNKAAAAMTMQVVSTTGERKEVRVWRRGGREGVRNEGWFWEEGLMECNLNEEEEEEGK